MQNKNYPEAITRTNWQKHGERPSLKDFGAKGDLQYLTAQVTALSPSIQSVFKSCTGLVDVSGTVVIGTGTKFLSELQVGQYLNIASNYGRIAIILDDFNLALESASIPTLSGQVFSTGTGFSSATDTGKRMVLYGGGSGINRESFQTNAANGIPTIDTYTALNSIDAQNATSVKFAANSFTNDITWEVFGANLSDFSDEVVVHGPTDITALAPSDTYIAVPTKRYYRAKVKSKTPGQPATAYVSCVSLGRMFAANILSVDSPIQVTLDAAPASSRDAAYAYFGTDDTAAIQLAFDTMTSLVPPGTADGGATLEAPRGKYLISSSITHRPCVTLKGHHGGGAIIQADGESFPVSTAIWNMTGTFATDQRIAFFTRLENIRIDCGHIPGSIGVYCDALQENSGLYKTAVIQWTKYGIQANTSSDRYGCTNWVVEDPWVYASPTAFADDTCRAYISDYALQTTFRRGTYIAQGGFICGYGIGLDISHGNAIMTGEIHVESARIGVYFNSGSGGSLNFFTGQSFVQTGVVINGGNATILKSIITIGQLAMNDILRSYISTEHFIGLYIFTPADTDTVLGTQLQLPGDITSPNVITLDNINFSQPNEGGFFSVNSRASAFPNWMKTSQNASNDAMFLRLSAQGIEVRQGPAVQPAYVAVGVCDVSGTAVTWVSGSLFNVSWPAGTQIILSGNIAASIASVGSTTSLTLSSSAGTLTGVTFGVSTDLTALGGTHPGASLFQAMLAFGGVQTPRLYFDTEVGFGALNFGNALDVYRARWRHGESSQIQLTLQRSTNSGSTWISMIRAYLDDGSVAFPGPIFPQAADKFQAGCYQGSGSPETVVAAVQGSIYLDTAGNLWFKQTGGSTSSGWLQANPGYWFDISSLISTNAIRTNKNVGIQTNPDTANSVVFAVAGISELSNTGINRVPGAGLDLDVNGNSELHGSVKLTARNASRPLKTDASKVVTDGKISGTTANDFDMSPIAASHFVGTDGSVLTDAGAYGVTTTINTAVTPNLSVVNGIITGAS